MYNFNNHNIPQSVLDVSKTIVENEDNFLSSYKNSIHSALDSYGNVTDLVFNSNFSGCEFVLMESSFSNKIPEVKEIKKLLEKRFEEVDVFKTNNKFIIRTTMIKE